MPADGWASISPYVCIYVIHSNTINGQRFTFLACALGLTQASFRERRSSIPVEDSWPARYRLRGFVVGGWGVCV